MFVICSLLMYTIIDGTRGARKHNRTSLALEPEQMAIQKALWVSNPTDPGQTYGYDSGCYLGWHPGGWKGSVKPFSVSTANKDVYHVLCCQEGAGDKDGCASCTTFGMTFVNLYDKLNPGSYKCAPSGNRVCYKKQSPTPADQTYPEVITPSDPTPEDKTYKVITPSDPTPEDKTYNCGCEWTGLIQQNWVTDRTCCWRECNTHDVECRLVNDKEGNEGVPLNGCTGVKGWNKGFRTCDDGSWE